MIQINNQNMNSSLSVNFNKILSQFNIYNDALINDFVNKLNLNIEFSDEIIEKEMGYLSCKDVIRNIKELWKSNDKIKSIIKNIDSVEELIEVIEMLAGEISLVNEVDFPEVYDSLVDLISLSKYRYYVISSHNDIFNTITFYPRAIALVASQGSLTEQEVYEAAFIKELYYLYYRYVGRLQSNMKFADSFQRRDYIRDVVVDSLASYYTFDYCNKFNISKMMYKHLFRVHPIIYPSAAYKWIVDTKHFEAIFKESLYSSDVAIKTLFKNDEEFGYMLINRDFHLSLIKNLYLKDKVCTLEPYDFIIEFEKYLNNFLTFVTSESYISWVKAAFEQYLNISLNILSVIDYDSRIYLVDLLLSKMTDKNKTTSNQKSAVNALKKFLETYTINWNGICIK